MARKARLRLIKCLPGLAAQAPALRNELQNKGVIIVSPRDECLRVVREWIVSDDSLLARMEANEITLTSLGEFVGRLASHSNLPLRRSASPLVQEALLAAEHDSIVNSTSLGLMATKSGFQAAAVQTMQKLRHYEVDAKDLSHLNPQMADLSAISSILECALEKHRLTTLSMRVQHLVETEPSVPNEIRRIVWIGEDVLEPLWAHLIRWLVDAGCTVSYFCETHPSNESFFPTPVFPQSEIEPDNDGEVVDTTALATLLPQHNVYGLNGSYADEAQGVQIIAVADEFLEVETALRDLRKRLKEGAPPASLVLYAPSLSEYGPLIHSAAIRLDVPLVMDYPIPLLQNPLARALYDLLEMLVTGSVHSISYVMRSPFTRAQPPEVAAWQSLLQQGLSDKEIWQQLAEKTTAELPAWTADLAAWRSKVADELGTAGDWIGRFRELLATLPWIHGNDFSEAEKRHGSALATMLRGAEAESIATLNRKLTLREWLRRVSARWKTQTAYVRVRDHDGLLVTDSVWNVGMPDVIYAVGMTEGRIPRKRTEDPLLPDRLCKAITGISLPTSYEQAYAMQRDFYRLLTSAPNIKLSFPKTFSEGDEVASSYLDDVRAALPSCHFRVIGFDKRLPMPTPDLEIEEQVAGAAWNAVEPPSPEAKNLMDQLKDETSRCDIVVLASPNILERAVRIPSPLRLDHLRAAEECAFRFLVLAQFRLRSPRQTSALSVVRAAIHKTNLSLPQTELLEELRRNCFAEIDAARPHLSQEEQRLLQLSAATLIDAFMRTEIAARERWQLRPKATRVSLHNTSLRKVFRTQGKVINLDATIDILYEVNGQEVPLIFGFAPGEGSDANHFDLRAAMYAALAAEDLRAAIFHDLSSGFRRAFQVRRPTETPVFVSRRNDDLYITLVDKSEFVSRIKERFERALNKIALGTVSPEPGEHCRFCKLEDLCRKEDNLFVPASEENGTPGRL